LKAPFSFFFDCSNFSSNKNDTGIIPNKIYTGMKRHLRSIAGRKQFIHTYTRNLIFAANNSKEHSGVYIKMEYAPRRRYGVFCRKCRKIIS
jgi:hypothetical protein